MVLSSFIMFFNEESGFFALNLSFRAFPKVFEFFQIFL